MLIIHIDLQHRTQDFEYLLDGIIGIMEQQIATVKNLLPGAKKSLPYVTDASKYSIRDLTSILFLFTHLTVIVFWKLVEINKVR